jgi:hypothetical protein
LPRKKLSELEKQREKVKQVYVDGPRRIKRVRGEAEMGLEVVAAKKVQACYLRAGDFEYPYIAEACGVSVDTIKRWFMEDEMQGLLAKVIEDQVDGAVKLLKTYAIELLEMLVNIARTTEDPDQKRKAINDALDRMGLAKVNKSESVVNSTSNDMSTVAITDPAGLVEKLRTAPPEVQARAAEHMEAMLALAGEHTDEDVTGGE